MKQQGAAVNPAAGLAWQPVQEDTNWAGKRKVQQSLEYNVGKLDVAASYYHRKDYSANIYRLHQP